MPLLLKVRCGLLKVLDFLRARFIEAVRYSELERQTRAHNLLDLIVVEKILGLKGATCSLYRLATYVCHRTF